MTPSGIEPATFRFVAQHLNHCATAVAPFRNSNIAYYKYDVLSSGFGKKTFTPLELCNSTVILSRNNKELLTLQLFILV